MDLNRMAVYTGLPVKQRIFLENAALRQDGPVVIKRKDEYLYEVWYNSIDYESGLRHGADPNTHFGGACSSISKGNWFGRNFDWFYSNEATFVIHTPAYAGRYASVGVARMSQLTKQVADTKKLNSYYKALPCFMMDGTNSAGVTASINVVPLDKGNQTAIPTGESYDTIYSNMIVRYILDNFSSATEAASFIQEHVTVIPIPSLLKQNDMIHCLVADGTDAFILEFIEGRTEIIEHPYMTNFHIYGVTFNANGSVYTPATADETRGPKRTNLIEDNGCGLERYNLIVGKYEDINSKETMRGLLKDLKYTRAYLTSPDPAPLPWYTECVGIDNLTVESTVIQYTPVLTAISEEYTRRSRETALTWQTCHSSVYDIQNHKLYICSQEQDTEYEFTI